MFIKSSNCLGKKYPKTRVQGKGRGDGKLEWTVNWSGMAEDPGFPTSQRQPWGCSKGRPFPWVAGRLTQERTQRTLHRPGGQGWAGTRLKRPRLQRPEQDDEEEEAATAEKGREAWAGCAVGLENVGAASLRACKSPHCTRGTGRRVTYLSNLKLHFS